MALAFSVIFATLGFFVTPEEAQRLLAPPVASSTPALVLDARDGWLAFRSAHLPGAVRIDWKDYRDGWGRTGRLPPDLTSLGGRLSRLGVRDDRPVLVYGDVVAGWGEEGRIAWMLAYLGHPAVHVLSGGISAWRAAGLPVERGSGASPPVGTFRVRLQPALRASRDDVLRASTTGAAQFIDVRSAKEFAGATPYFEARGGHIPGALSLPWQRLFDDAGRALPPERLKAVLQSAGISPGRPLILYCTGGVRSAMAWAALRSAGVAQAQNYDGSFWEWAADRDLAVTK